MKSVILLEDKFNDENIVFIKSFMPTRVYYVSTHKRIGGGYYEYFAEYMANEHKNVEVCLKYIDDVSIRAVNRVLYEIISEDKNLEAISAYCSNNLLSILFVELARKNNVPIYYVDLPRKRIFDLTNGLHETDIKLKDISVSEYVDVSGGRLLNTTTDISIRSEMRILIDYIVQNQPLWKDLKSILARGDVFEHSTENKEEVVVILENLDKNDYLTFRELKNFLKRIKFVKTSPSKSGNLLMKFKNSTYKNMLFVTGMWFEAFTFLCVKSIEGVKDVQSGIAFNWNETDMSVNNEVDVLASYGSKLFCISCKDTANYDVNVLNELQIYADRIGGNHVKALLVATEEPKRDILKQRAHEMGINLIVFDGNVLAFRRKLQSVFLYD